MIGNISVHNILNDNKSPIYSPDILNKYPFTVKAFYHNKKESVGGLVKWMKREFIQQMV